MCILLGGFGFGGGGFSGGGFGGDGFFSGQSSSSGDGGFFFEGSSTTSQQQQQPAGNNGERFDLINRVLPHACGIIKILWLISQILEHCFTCSLLRLWVFV